MFDKVEPETRHFLKKILKTVFVGLFWMFGHVILGIFMELGYVHNGFSIANILYYSFLVVSLLWLIRFMYKLWNH